MGRGGGASLRLFLCLGNCTRGSAVWRLALAWSCLSFAGREWEDSAQVFRPQEPPPPPTWLNWRTVPILIQNLKVSWLRSFELMAWKHGDMWHLTDFVISDRQG